MHNYQAPEQLLKDRIILVSGASNGIGRAAAKTYAAYGATVILLGRNENKLNAVYDEIVAMGAPQPAITPVDLETTTETEYRELAEMLKEEFGRLDGLLHNASILGELAPLGSYSADTWQRVMQINVNGTFLLNKAMLPLLQESSEASIVFTTSSVGRKGRAFWGAYAASKFATEGLAQTLAEELENTSKIRVNTINPGATRTAMRATAFPAEQPESISRPEDIMPLYLYLMGDDSTEIHGQSLDAQPKL